MHTNFTSFDTHIPNSENSVYNAGNSDNNIIFEINKLSNTDKMKKLLPSPGGNNHVVRKQEALPHSVALAFERSQPASNPSSSWWNLHEAS